MPGLQPHIKLCLQRIIPKLLALFISAVKDPMKKKKARNMVRTKFEERYKSGKNRWVKCLMIIRVMRVLNIAKICEYEIILVF